MRPEVIISSQNYEIKLDDNQNYEISHNYETKSHNSDNCEIKTLNDS